MCFCRLQFEDFNGDFLHEMNNIIARVVFVQI